MKPLSAMPERELGAAAARALEQSVLPPLGARLREERCMRDMSIEELAQTTRIPVAMLQHLEEDRLAALPGDVFARGFIRAYARAVQLPEGELLRAYARRRAPADTPRPLPLSTVPERGRRFGIAIALVILAVLFTLALSIVLRPRHRGMPMELSWHHSVPVQLHASTLAPTSRWSPADVAPMRGV
ncbi:MAG: helix-turn-helix domain-containing protein [Polyangiales bacterium]